MSEKIVLDPKIEFAIRFKWEPAERVHWVNFECVEAVAHFVNNQPVFLNYDVGTGAGDCQDFDTAFAENPLCTGFIKWDGCMEIHDFTKHFCGYGQRYFLYRLYSEIYAGAHSIMGYIDMHPGDEAKLDHYIRTKRTTVS